MRAVVLIALLAAGCSPPATTGNSEIDLNGAADRAQGDIQSYNSDPGGNAAAPEAPLAPADPGQPGGLPDDRTPVSEAPAAAGSGQEAARLVQTYYALIEGRKYDQARLLWGENAKLDAPAFAASFAKYREYHANVGAPGEVEGAAGSRYVSVPVQVYARMKDGRPEYQLGSVVLRRVGDVDGATPEQKKWHIYSIDLEPAPGKAIAARPAGPGEVEPPRVATARYRCMDGGKIRVRFDNQSDVATVAREGESKRAVTLTGQKPASGIWYRKDGYELRGKGDAATFTRPGQPPIACTVIR